MSKKASKKRTHTKKADTGTTVEAEAVATTVEEPTTVENAGTVAPSTQDVAGQETGKKMATITLTKRLTEKSGNTSYARPGVRASVYFNKNMFAGEPPETIEITAENLAEPGQIVPDADKEAKAAAKAAKLAESAAKAEAKAAKLKEQLAKAQEKADKLAGKVAAQ